MPGQMQMTKRGRGGKLTVTKPSEVIKGFMGRPSASARKRDDALELLSYLWVEIGAWQLVKHVLGMRQIYGLFRNIKEHVHMTHRNAGFSQRGCVFSCASWSFVSL